MHVLRVEPSLWKEGIMVSELFVEALQVDGQGVLAGDIVHAQEVIDALVRLELRKEVRRDAMVLPANIPVQIFISIGQKLLQLVESVWVVLKRELRRLCRLLRHMGFFIVANCLIILRLSCLRRESLNPTIRGG